MKHLLGSLKSQGKAIVAASLACQIHTGSYRLKIISARAEKGLDQFTVPTGTGTFGVLTSSKVKNLTHSSKRYADMAFLSRVSNQHPPPKQW